VRIETAGVRLTSPDDEAPKQANYNFTISQLIKSRPLDLRVF